MSTPWSTLNISRSWYYKLKRRQHHLSLLIEFETWKDSGTSEEIWSPRYKSHMLRRLRVFFNRYPLATVESLLDYISDNVGVSARRDRFNAVSLFVRFLVATDRAPRSLYETIRAYHPRRSKYDQPVVYTLSEVQADEVARKCDMCSFILETGVRLGEFINTTVDDCHPSFDPKLSYVHIKMGKGGKSRYVPLSKSACALDLGYVLRSKNYDSFSKHVRRLSDQLSFKFTTHSFRHFRATQWANNPNIPIAAVQKWLGHSSIQTTMKYVHFDDLSALKHAQ